MTDIIESHRSQGPITEAADKRPWKAPRLIDLHDLETRGMDGGQYGDNSMNKIHHPDEGQTDSSSWGGPS